MTPTTRTRLVVAGCLAACALSISYMAGSHQSQQTPPEPSPATLVPLGAPFESRPLLSNADWTAERGNSAALAAMVGRLTQVTDPPSIP